MSEPDKACLHDTIILDEGGCHSPYFSLQSRNVTHGLTLGKPNKALTMGSEGGPGGKRARLRRPLIKM